MATPPSGTLPDVHLRINRLIEDPGSSSAAIVRAVIVELF